MPLPAPASPSADDCSVLWASSYNPAHLGTVFKPSPYCVLLGSDPWTVLTSLHPGLGELDAQGWQPVQRRTHILPSCSLTLPGRR